MKTKHLNTDSQVNQYLNECKRDSYIISILITFIACLTSVMLGCFMYGIFSN